MSTKLLINACKKNDINVIKGILHKNRDIDIESINSNVFTMICKYINSDTLEWLISEYPDINIRYNNYECLKILWKNNKTLFDTIIDYYWTPTQLLSWASLTNNLDICRYIDRRYGINSNNIPNIYITNILKDCIRLRHKEILLYLIGLFDTDNDIALVLVLKSLKHGDHNLANELCRIYNINNLTVGKNWLFKESCRFCDISSLNWLIEKDHNIINDNDIDECILNAISCDNIDIFTWLLENRNREIDKFLYTRDCIMNDSINIFKYLGDKYNIPITFYTFNDMCAYGSISILKNILSDHVLDFMTPDNIDRGFYIAGINENHDIMGLLLNKYSNIDMGMCNNIVFKKACENNNNNIAKLFTENRPDVYSIVYENGDITSYMIKQNIKSHGKKIVSEIHNCAICLHKESEIITDCQHQFCWECINNWHMMKENCPYCRKNSIEFYEITREL